ncbi:MAG: leucine-rich repeat domain-containing protein, partial [Pseudomonadota bacterium]
MADADIAYRIAEERIAKARAEDLPFLNLSPEGRQAYGVAWEAEARLAALPALPPEIANLTALQRLDLRSTQVADIAPLASLSALHTLSLQNTQVADIAPLENLSALQALTLHNTQVADI